MPFECYNCGKSFDDEPYETRTILCGAWGIFSESGEDEEWTNVQHYCSAFCLINDLVIEHRLYFEDSADMLEHLETQHGIDREDLIKFLTIIDLENKYIEKQKEKGLDLTICPYCHSIKEKDKTTSPQHQDQALTIEVDGLEKNVCSLTLKKPKTLPSSKSITPAKSEKIPRNAPCPCGSGKKYKKCCLNSTR